MKPLRSRLPYLIVAALWLPPAAAAETDCLPGLVVVRLDAQHLKATGDAVAAIDALRVPGIEILQVRTVLPQTDPTDAEPLLASTVVVEYAGGEAPQAVAARFIKRAGVVYAEPHYTHRVAAVPNDPYWTVQRGLTRMKFPQAWDVARAEGSDVVVAIVDGGTDWQHVDLAANIWNNADEIPGNGLDDDANGFVDDVRGWNFTNSSNDPTGVPSTPLSFEHGTLVAGIVGAVTNNGIGVAGGAWNVQTMPVCAALAGADNVIGFGFEGILYAAANGADIINCSWGAYRPPSRFEQDVITWAWQHGSAVVAAAGNSAGLYDSYPAAYTHVLSVAGADENDVIFYGRGAFVDLSATGYAIWATRPANGYTSTNGSSAAAPAASAACALVKALRPACSPDEMMERVRVTAVNTDAVQTSLSFVGLTGRGRLDASRALSMTTPSVRITGISVVDGDEDGAVEPGESAQVSLTVTNFLDQATQVSCIVRHDAIFLREFPLDYPSFVRVTNGGSVMASLSPMQSAALPPFTIQVQPDAPDDYVFYGSVEISAASPAYSDLDRFRIPVRPTYATHDANNFAITVSSVGRVGHMLDYGGNQWNGVGARFRGGADLLAEGSLLIGTSPAHVSDALVGAHFLTNDKDFQTAPGGYARVRSIGTGGDQQSFAQFDDSGSPAALGVLVSQVGSQYAAPPDDDYLILTYTIQNVTAAPLLGLRVGWFCDWDVDRVAMPANRTGFDAGRSLGYMWDAQGAGAGTYVGIRVLTPPEATGYRGVYLDSDDPANPGWGISDGFTSQEKWEVLSQGIVSPTVGPGDVAHGIATGPFDIAPSGSIIVAFAFVAAEGLPDLQANADAAQARWNAGLPSDSPQPQDLQATAIANGVRVAWTIAPNAVPFVRHVTVQRSFRSNGVYSDLQGGIALTPSVTMMIEDRDIERGAEFWYRLKVLGWDGSVTTSAPVSILAGRDLHRTRINSAVQTVRNEPVEIRYSIGSSVEEAQIRVFDVVGHRLATIALGARPVGDYLTVWDAKSSAGVRIGRGLYLLQLEAGPARSSSKVLVR